jgi:hypothetical protein
MARRNILTRSLGLAPDQHDMHVAQADGCRPWQMELPREKLKDDNW